MVNVTLNDEGKKLWSYVFSDGQVPVLSYVPTVTILDRIKRQVYIVDWDNLTPVQRALIIQHLAKMFQASEHEVEKAILSDGLPIRASLVSTPAIPMRFF